MAKPKPKVPFATAFPKPVSIREEDWSRAEKAFGHPLLPQLRERMLRLTQHYVTSVAYEQSAAPLDPARTRAEKIRKAFIAAKELIDQRGEADDAALYADELIALHLGQAVLHPRQSKEYLDPVASTLSRYIDACDDALHEMKLTADAGLWRDGSAWEEWIARLTDVLDDHGLPTSVRKDVDKNLTGQASPFVRLVRELQSCLPPEYRKTPKALGSWSSADAHPDVGLSEAISRARSRVRGTKSRRPSG